jgi:3-oxoadipate enol-lactonase
MRNSRLQIRGKMSTKEINSTTVYYEEAGKGPAILFIHGMAGFAGVWADQMARLSDAFHTVAYDRRGHTRSSKGNNTQETVELHADDAAALIQALDLAPVILVGSSGGARISIDVLRRHPALVRGAVLSEPPVFSLSQAIGAEFMAQVKPAIGLALESTDPSSAVDVFFRIIDPTFWDNAPMERKEIYRANLPAMLADLRMPPYALTLDDLRTISRPCVVMYGSASLKAFTDIAKMVAGAIPNCQLKELTGAGHATYAHRPTEFAAAVRQYAATL